MKVLPDAEYNHFLMLCVAARICSCDIYKNYISIASQLFKLYVEDYITIYGRHTIGSNVHNLIHVTEDMQRCGVGNLMQISTYKFENSLRVLTLKLKHSNRPLEQLVRRTLENEQIDRTLHSNLFHPIPFVPRISCELKQKNVSVFKKIELSSDTFLSSRRYDLEIQDSAFKGNDAWFLTKSSDIVKMLFVQKIGIDFIIHGLKIKTKDSFFKTPIDSRKIDIYTSPGELETDSRLYNINSIKAKMMCIEIGKQSVFIPLLHSLEVINQL